MKPQAPREAPIQEQPEPTNPYSFGKWFAEKFGIPGAALIGMAALIYYGAVYYQKVEERNYNDTKAHRIELMAYLTNRNEGEAKRAIADAELARSLMTLSTALDRQTLIIERLDREARTAHTTQAPRK